MHTPASQASCPEHVSVSSHAVPSGAAGSEQEPVAASHVPASWHWWRQTTGSARAARRQESVWVQASPSAHAVPSGRGVRAGTRRRVTRPRDVALVAGRTDDGIGSRARARLARIRLRAGVAIAADGAIGPVTPLAYTAVAHVHRRAGVAIVARPSPVNGFELTGPVCLSHLSWVQTLPSSQSLCLRAFADAGLPDATASGPSAWWPNEVKSGTEAATGGGVAAAAARAAAPQNVRRAEQRA